MGYANRTSENIKFVSAWKDMILRCKNKNSESYKSYGGIGIDIDPRWSRCDYFLEDITKLPGYDEMMANPNIKYSLDKDILQQGIPDSQKIYSQSTCMWVPMIDNINQVTIDHINEAKVKYNNVNETHGGTYAVRVRDKYTHKKRNFGNYPSLKYAVPIANFCTNFYGNGVINDWPNPLSVEECLLHRIYQHPPVEMCTVVKDNSLPRLMYKVVREVD